MSHDSQLLREFVERRSEAAFAELVRRHLGLVYHAAGRQLGQDAHLAEDVAQGVFLALAREAKRLARHPNLAGWLYCTTRFKVGEMVRTERRKRIREERAAAMQDPLAPAGTTPDWARIRPVLDEAVLSLSERDREAIRLRFFSGLPFVGIAAQLKLTERAAQMRVQRALVKLRDRLARRGIESTGAALSLAMENAIGASNPPGLATAVTRAVMLAPLPPSGVGWFHAGSTVKLAAALAGMAAVLAGGFALQSVLRLRKAESALVRATTAVAMLEGELHASHQRAVAETRTAKQAAATARQQQVDLAERDRAQAGDRFLREHPDIRAAFVRQIAAERMDEFGPFLLDRGPSEAQINRFIALTVRLETWDDSSHHMEFNFEAQPFAKGEFHREMDEILGPGGYAAYRAYDQRYTQMTGMRALVQDVQRASYYDGSSPTAAQRDALTALIVNSQPPPAGAHAQYTIPWDAVMAGANGVLQGAALDALAARRDEAAYGRALEAAFASELPPGVMTIVR